LLYVHHLSFCVALTALSSFGCGGSKAVAKSPPVGQSDPAHSPAPPGDLDVPPGGADSVAPTIGRPAPDKGADGGEKSAGTGTGAAVTFRLKNSAKDDLVFSVDKGWQPVIFAFSGQPPNAKGILMFPKHCTASCELSGKERCPVCEAPEKVKDIIAAETREVVAPGKSFDVPWDGQVYRHDKKDCDCYRREPVPPETYTVRACGLRITKSAKQSTKLQCADGSMTFPADRAQVVELNFPAP
jgi:hypothetical protein